MSSTIRRTVAIIVVAAGVATGLIADRDGEARQPISNLAVTGVGAPKNALTSAWYCPIVFASKANPTAGFIVVTNTNDRPISATLSVHPSTGSQVDVPLNVNAYSRATFNPGNVVDSEYASVLLQIEGGGVAVENGVRDGNGESSTPCSADGSSTWYTADGSTDSADEKLALFNPFSDVAIVDVAASTDAGRAEPDEFRGIVINPRSTHIVNLGDQMRRRQWISASVEARRGRLVVGQLQTGNVREVPGISLSLAVPSVQRDITLPSGVVSEGTTDRVTLYNPSNDEVNVVVRVVPDNGAEPVELPTIVPAQSRFARLLETETSIPRDVRTSVRVLTADGNGIVASRTTTAVAPSRFTGYTISNGSPVAATRWAFGAFDATDPKDSWAWITNNSTEATEVRVAVLGEGTVTEVAKLMSEPGKPLAVHVDGLPGAAGKAVLFEADREIFVQRQTVAFPGATLTSAPAVALR